MAARCPGRVDAIHTNLLPVGPSALDDPMGMFDEQGLADYRNTSAFRATERGYEEVQSTKPQ